MEHPILENLKWRYATKKFNAERKIDSKDLEILKEAVRLSASSYGLQPYHIIMVENKDLREQIKNAAWNQTQITEASNLFVFANITNVGVEEIKNYIENTANTREIPVSNLKGFEDMMNNSIATLPNDIKENWTAKQTYIALGTLLTAAAELKIDATPMEGFNREEVNKILNLTEKGLSASLIVTLGYRDEEDPAQFLKKVRKPKEELFITL
ncbi:NAD(P)H-dependent oxidoreductase [Flavobacterium sp.]|uniref:NAD(P)H-dependent oxidoreductase n=1 Tax=Flavobacterium sp. TaxID=239 RepID=UPI002632CDB9|nr:NAD(P)H-dependent oxidoreductase [Flavobacterium sp.]MDD3003800.1 NAD(P)H-dependent oxidoreductase [Flavobacterium sp.]